MLSKVKESKKPGQMCGVWAMRAMQMPQMQTVRNNKKPALS